MNNPWFRMYAEFANDPKVQMLSEAMQRRLLMLFCMRCNGLVTLQDEEVTFQLRISAEEWGQTKATFVAKGFIDFSNNILNWDKRQYKSDSSLERVRKHRDAKKQGNVTSGNVTVTVQNRTDTDKIKEKNKQKRKSKVDLAAWEKLNGQLTPDILKGYQEKNKITDLRLSEMITQFRLKCEAQDYRYADFTKAFQSWDWSGYSPNHQLIKKPAVTLSKMVVV